MVEAVDRLDFEASHLAVLQHIKRHRGARRALGPDLAIKIGQVLRLLAIDPDDDVAALDAGRLCRTARRHAADEWPPAQLFSVEPKPRAPRSRRPPGGNQVAEDRREPIDRHEHVAWRLFAAAGRIPDDQRADADKLAFTIDQRRAAPGWVGRRGEERLIEQIFPATGEFALGYDIGAAHHGRTAKTCDQHGIAFPDFGGLAQRHRLELERLDRAQQAEARFVVVTDDVRRYGTAIIIDDFGCVS